MLRADFAASAAIAQPPDGPQYLTDYSPSDKPWDVHRAQAQHVEYVYSDTIFDSLARRMQHCSGYLGFSRSVDVETGEISLKLKTARFCRVRHCPVCQWRRSLMWQARFLQALPSIETAYPSARWLFLTLTVRNVPISELRFQIRQMNKAWHRFVLRPEFASNVQGWIRTTEVTRGADDSAHPHFHCLLMVKPSYFGKGYVTQSRWTELWKECARLDYTPIVDIRAVKPKLGSTTSALRNAVAETLKYAVKPSDMNDDWLIELTRQVHKLHFIASGGVLKNVLREADESDEDLMLLTDGDDPAEDEKLMFFDWRRSIKRYTKR